MESAIACNRRGESKCTTRSSTSRNRFSSRNARSEAFHAGLEPLPVRRALHNSAGPDPDTNSAPNSSPVGSAERNVARRRASTSGNRGNLPDVEITSPRNPLAGREPFSRHTVPRDVAVSRTEILRKYGKEKENPWKIESSRRWSQRRIDSAVVEKEERPRTLPSTAKRSSKECSSKPCFQSGRKISRQEILRRRASVDVPVAVICRGRGEVEEKVESSEVKGGNKPSSSFPRKNVPRPRNDAAGWGGKEDERESKSVCDFLAVTSKLQDITRGLVPRPSTLPKIIHASRSARISAEDWASPRLAKDAVRREPPVYGRIRRRKSSLPSNAGTLRGSARERAVDVEFRASSIATRHLRDPVPDTLYRSPASTSPRGNAIYAKVCRKTWKGLQSQGGKADSKDSGDNRVEGEVDGGRTMSRRRIIENTRENKGDDSVEIQGESRSESQSCRSKDDAAEARGGKRESNEAEICKDAARSGSKSQSGLTEREIGASRLAATLPSCVKSSRKCLAEAQPRIDGKSSTGIPTKRNKERSNYLKKSSHVRAYSDANSGRSNSPVTTSSIFGFCTGKRKVQSTNSAAKVESVSICPTWNVKTVSMAKCYGWKNIILMIFSE